MGGLCRACGVMGTDDNRPVGDQDRGKPGADSVPVERIRRPGKHRSLPSPWDDHHEPEPRSPSRPLTDAYVDPQIRWQNQKMESLGLMADGVAHDFGNCLLAIVGNADLLDQDLPPESNQRQLVTEIHLAAERAGDLCKQLLAFAGKGQFHIQPVDLSLTVRGMVGMLKAGISPKISLCLELIKDLPLIEADISQIHQVIMNLVVNASEAIGHQTGVITLRTGIRSASDSKFDHNIIAPRSTSGTYVVLEVIDSGSGMDPKTMSRAFDPFFSTKPQGRGLGLASVLGIIRTHCGSVGLSTETGLGTTVTVLFPRNKTATPRVAPSLRRPRVKSSGTILVVDDEEYLRVLSERMLTHLGYRVYLAEGGAMALEICQKHADELDCVVLDLIMPDMDGSEVQAELRKLYPDLKVLLISGYHELEISRRFAGHGLAGFLQKPYMLEELGRKLDEVINHAAEQAPPPVD